MTTALDLQLIQEHLEAYDRALANSYPYTAAVRVRSRGSLAALSRVGERIDAQQQRISELESLVAKSPESGDVRTLREVLIQAVNGNPVSADEAWAVIHAWDDMAARPCVCGLPKDHPIHRTDRHCEVASPHEWLFHPNHDGWGIVECRRCHKFDRYRLQGVVTEYPGGECHG